MAIDESRNGKPNGIQLVQVEGFLEVARRGSVSRAAEALFITQPTLTARLHGLERELGTPLFLRTPHGMRLTDAGRAWIPFAERALRALVDGRDALQQVMTASAGHLMIAAAPAVSTYVLPEMLEKFVAAHPPSYYEIPQGAFLSAGVSLRGMMELDSIEAAKKMAERGLGVALLPGTAVAREVEGGTLCLVKMKDAPRMQNTIVAYRRRDAGKPEGIVAAFLELLENRA